MQLHALLSAFFVLVMILLWGRWCRHVALTDIARVAAADAEWQRVRKVQELEARPIRVSGGVLRVAQCGAEYVPYF